MSKGIQAGYLAGHTGWLLGRAYRLATKGGTLSRMHHNPSRTMETLQPLQHLFLDILDLIKHEGVMSLPPAAFVHTRHFMGNAPWQLLSNFYDKCLTTTTKSLDKFIETLPLFYLFFIYLKHTVAILVHPFLGHFDY